MLEIPYTVCRHNKRELDQYRVPNLSAVIDMLRPPADEEWQSLS